MKQLVRLAVVILAVCGILLFTISRLNASQGYSGNNTLTVYNWGDYIDPEVLDSFEEETGITVIYETFDTNEAMMTKIQQGGTSYDIAVPSEYMIEKLKEEDLLLPIDHSKIPNLKNIDERFLDLSFDPDNKYSIPYFWGTVGIVYNSKQLNGMKINSWDDLWNPTLKNEIIFTDSPREIIGMGLNSLGYSLNDTDPHHLQEAYDKLVSLKPNVKALLGDENKMLLASGEASIGVVWSGDASEIMSENEDLDYVLPEEGSNLWFDNMVIPKTAKNVDAAHKFMNYMLDPKVAAKNTEYVSYSTPNEEALQYMPEEMVNDKRFYPSPEQTERLEVYENLGPEKLGRINELFLQFKME
ncbi:spermidine/putrescine transport system substrate-binding protein [Terribacillus aidingensis]|uniref:Spermidine/putrescine transport system substrate-binding protein n=1 Tax=Terribacillus aidingensis TaxID=586416 RepID=A0A285N6E1_9BACI|nr:ABC transporter substrate-binding protein [Terribacillus aidingensis]SNZ03556.1 spermidine/putrescine transport system substrate-binding protein [Terribacillus aidingensis]